MMRFKNLREILCTFVSPMSSKIKSKVIGKNYPHYCCDIYLRAMNEIYHYFTKINNTVYATKITYVLKL